jgi:hypothetical protein
MTDRAVQPEAPTTKAGRVLLEQEAYNSRSFPLITVEAIVAIEAEARAASQPLAQERPQPLDNEVEACRHCSTPEAHPTRIGGILTYEGRCDPETCEKHDHSEPMTDRAVAPTRYDLDGDTFSPSPHGDYIMAEDFDRWVRAASQRET